ncbi:MAG: hypothetical protein LPK02_07030 [Rhodobacterales bacterium]|nr:hypothetical protein [Rhodobacterales bacterium]
MMIPRDNVLITNYRSSKVRRYGSRPEVPAQSTGDHSHGMLVLLYCLHSNPSPALVKAITFHDADELFGGDIPYPFKREEPELAMEHDGASKQLAIKHGVLIPDQLDMADAYWLAFLDRVETILWLAVTAPMELTCMEWVMMAQELHNTRKKLELNDPALIEVLNLPNSIRAYWMAAA